MTSKVYGTATSTPVKSGVREHLAPTPHLRWHTVAPYLAENGLTVKPKPILEQWWAPDVPSYMITAGQGEWRQVGVVNDE